MPKSYDAGALSAYAIAVEHGYEGTEEQFAAELTGATDAARAAAQEASDAEAYAIGKRGGVDVGSSDPAYHNNAKYYSETLTTDPSLSISGRAADAKVVGDEVDTIRSNDIRAIDDLEEIGSVEIVPDWIRNTCIDETGEIGIPSTKRVTNKTLIYIPVGVSIVTTVNDALYTPKPFCFDKNKVLLGIAPQVNTLIEGTRYIRFRIARIDDGELTVDNVLSYLTITFYKQPLYNKISEEINPYKDKTDSIIEENSKNLLFDATWDSGYSDVSFNGNCIRVTAVTAGSYKGAYCVIDVTEANYISVSYKSITPSDAKLRYAFLVEGAFAWQAYISTSPTVIDVSEQTVIRFGLYITTSSEVQIGDYAEFEELQIEYGNEPSEYVGRYSAIDYVARSEIANSKSTIAVVNPDNHNFADADLWEAGGIDATRGINITQKNSIRLKDYFEVESNNKLYFQAYYALPDSRTDYTNTNNNNLRNGYILQYDNNGNYIGRLSIVSINVICGSKLTLSNDCKYVRFALYTSILNTDMTAIMPSVIYADIVDSDLWLPPYYENYLVDKAEIINHYMRNEVYNSSSNTYTKLYDPNAKLISFVFITDNHYTDDGHTQYNQKYSPCIIKRLAEMVNIPLIMNGGDVDHSGLWTDLFCNQLRKAFNGEIHYAVGNHEFLSSNTGTNLYYDMDSQNTNQIGDEDHHYYYVDNPQLKLRILVLASNMESQTAMGTGTGASSQDGYTTEQATWVNDVALGTLPTGWDVIVFTHFFYAIDSTTGGPSLSRGTSILGTLANNPSVIAVFQGHTHFDRIVKGKDSVAGNLPIIITSCDKNIIHNSEYSVFPNGYPVNRSSGTIFEQLMDVVIINRSTKTISLIRVGGKAQNGVNDDEGTETEIRTVTYGS